MPQEASTLSAQEAERYFELHQMLREFSELFDYEEPNDRAIAIVGPAFLDTLLTETLTNFFVANEKEVQKLLRPEGPLGTYGARVSTCLCLGLIDELVAADLRLVGKIRNRFAHDLRASFNDPQIGSWCSALRWHKDFYATPPVDASHRDLFQVGVNQLVAHLNGIVGVARVGRRQKRPTA